MSRPQVAIVTPTLDVMGGTEQIVGLEAQALMTAADVTFVTPASQSPNPRPDVIPVRYRRLPGVLGTEAWFRAATRAIDRCDKSFDAIYSPGINCGCATHINVYGNFSEWVEISAGVPIRSSLVEAQRRFRFRRLAAWEQRLYRNPATRLATISHKAARRMEKDFGRSDIAVFPSTPEPDRFTELNRTKLRRKARLDLNVTDNEYFIVTLGNAWHSKGFDLLYQAWAGLTDCASATLGIVTVERPGHLKKMLGPPPAGVRFLPRQRQVEALYAAADLVILASRGETFGLPIAEAGAMGTPVLVSEHAGVSDYVPSSCVVRPNTADAWRVALETAIHGTPDQSPTGTVVRDLAAHDPAARAEAFVDWVLNR